MDKATGTIALKAEFDNADHALWPGQFIDVSLVLTTLEKAVVVPSQAVQTGQQGAYVFVVDAAGAAAVRPITPGPAVGGRTVIDEGPRGRRDRRHRRPAAPDAGRDGGAQNRARPRRRSRGAGQA